MIADELKKKIEELEKENAHLRRENQRIVEEKDRIVERLEKEKEHIEKEFEEFKAKHAVTVSNLRGALKIRADAQGQSKPLGAPKNHKGYYRHVPERIDCIKPLIPKRCPDCNSKLEGDTQEVRSRFVTDINIFLKAKTTRYDIHRKYCRNCKRLVEPEVPGVFPHARLGLNLMLLVMYLRLGLRLPGNKVCSYLSDMYGLKISEAGIVVVLKQLVIAFGDYYSYLEKIVKLAKVKYADSTGWRVNGKNYFAWVFIASGIVLYKIRKRNNHKVGMALFGKQKGNVLVVDRHSAFRTLAEKVGFLLQLCWSHILQDSKELEEHFGSEGKYVHKMLKEIFELSNGLNHKGTPEMVEQLKAEVFLLTQRHYKHKTVWKFVNNLYYRDAENLFRFVTNPDIDPTNNISERKLRHLVIIRKISNGSRSSRGANATAMLLSIIQTLQSNKVNILTGLKNILKNPSRY